MADTLADRMKLVIDARADRRGKFAQLEDITGIPAENWKSFYYGRQRPNPDMIEAICRTWPEHALWLTTGVTDSAHAQIGVPEAYLTELNLAERPEQMSCIEYLQLKCKIQQNMQVDGRTQLTKEELHEIYEQRYARDNERFGQLTRHRLRKDGQILGYFDPRMLRHDLNDQASHDNDPTERKTNDVD